MQHKVFHCPFTTYDQYCHLINIVTININAGVQNSSACLYLKLNINPSIPYSYFFPSVYCIYIIWILNHFLKIPVHIFHAFYNCTRTYHSMKTCTCLVKIKEMQALYRYFNTKRVVVFRKVQHYNFQNQFFLCDIEIERKDGEREFILTNNFLHNNLIFLPQDIECTPTRVSWGYRVAVYPPPTGILVKIIAGVCSCIHGIVDWGSHSNTGWRHTHGGRLGTAGGRTSSDRGGALFCVVCFYDRNDVSTLFADLY